MWRCGFCYPGILLMTVMAILASPAAAEIYKWVDAQGNVHFGDKPKDQKVADQAEPVDIVESYQPAEMTDEEQQAFDREQEALRRKTQTYRQEDQQKQKLAQDKRKKEKAELCATLQEDIRKFTSMDVVDGVRTYYYLTGEDGESVSSKQQKEIIENLKREYAALGCT